MVPFDWFLGFNCSAPIALLPAHVDLGYDVFAAAVFISCYGVS